MPEQLLESHSVANLLPMMTIDEYAGLVADIREHGQLEPIYLAGGKIIDGRNRYKACVELGIKPICQEWKGNGSLVAFVVSQNIKRRHLTPSQRAPIALDVIRLLEMEAAERQRQHGGTAPGRKSLTQKVGEVKSDRHEGEATAQAAALVGSNRSYVADAMSLRQADPDALQAVRDGKITMTEAIRNLKEQKREARRQENREKVAAVPAADVALAGAKFATIVIDPPWDFGDEGDNDQMGRSRPDYATMPIEQLLELPVAQFADADCHLYLWITNRSMPKGFALLDKWGFRFVTILTWGKPCFGLGNYFRGQTEHVLFGVRGSQLLKRRDVGTLLLAPRAGGHSAKPVEFYSLVESCSPGPYLEMFSRSARHDWASWGEGQARERGEDETHEAA
jgi:N6-adenosine-specific RNA methylase IME4